MAGGTWSTTELKVRPGLYMNFKAAAAAQISGAARGIVAIPVRANWGPIKKLVEISNEKDLIDAYTDNLEGGATAYKEIKFALMGAPKKVLAYRLADADAKKALVTLKDEESTDVLTLSTKYETDRPFKVTVRDNIIDDNKYDIVLYEGSKLLYTFTFDKGAAAIDNAVKAVNEDKGNKWIQMIKKADGNGTLEAVTSKDLTGGNAGIEGITNADYMEALDVFESAVFNVLALDGICNAELQASIAAWVERVRKEGKKVLVVMGGSKEEDQDVAVSSTRSRGFNNEAVHNVTVGGVLGGNEYCSAEIAPYIAGLIAGQKLNESITYHVTPFEDVTNKLSNSEVIALLQAGSLVLVNDGEKVIIEQGINTLTSLKEGQNNQWKKTRAVRVMDSISDDMLKSARDGYIGKVTNNEDGQASLIAACKQYMEKLANEGIIASDFAVMIDPQYQPSAEPDEVYIYWNASITDSMEKIYGTFTVR